MEPKGSHIPLGPKISRNQFASLLKIPDIYKWDFSGIYFTANFMEWRSRLNDNGVYEPLLVFVPKPILIEPKPSALDAIREWEEVKIEEWTHRLQQMQEKHTEKRRHCKWCHKLNSRCKC